MTGAAKEVTARDWPIVFRATRPRTRPLPNAKDDLARRCLQLLIGRRHEMTDVRRQCRVAIDAEGMQQVLETARARSRRRSAMRCAAAPDLAGRLCQFEDVSGRDLLPRPARSIDVSSCR
jgi:hypothetical protein